MIKKLIFLLSVFSATKADAEILPVLPPTIEFVEEVTTESGYEGIFFTCDLFKDSLSSDVLVFYKVCRVRGGGKSAVKITTYEAFGEEVTVWTAEGFAEE